MRPLTPVTPSARLALGIAFFVVFVAGWSLATFGGFVSKTFLADPLTMVRSGWTLLATQGFGWDIGWTVWRVFGGFVIVAVCFWVIKRERQRKQRTGNQEGKSDEQQ